MSILKNYLDKKDHAKQTLTRLTEEMNEVASSKELSWEEKFDLIVNEEENIVKFLNVLKLRCYFPDRDLTIYTQNPSEDKKRRCFFYLESLKETLK